MDSYISFPKLGIKWHIEQGIRITDSYSIKWYGIIICAAFILCVSLALRACEKHGIRRDDLLDYILVAVPCAIIGARLYYVIFSLDEYRDDWTDIFKIWQGGLAIYGGIIAAVIAVIVLSKIKKKSFIPILDFAFPYIILGQAIGRWGNFVNQEVYGRSTDLPWGMTGNLIAGEFGEELVHPLFLYESLWCLLAFAVMMLLRKRLTSVGQMTAVYLILYGAERAFVEGLRPETFTLMLGGMRVSQWLSVALCVTGVVILLVIFRRTRRQLADETAVEENSLSRLARAMEEKGREEQQQDEH